VMLVSPAQKISQKKIPQSGGETMKREFPFQARFISSGRIVTVLDAPSPGHYAVEGWGLVSKLLLVPVDDAQGMPRICAESTAIESDSSRPQE
jgi:hypothetical protein